jgi:CHAT domain-containing protein
VPLARLPWELLHDEHGFLLQQGAVTLTRHVQFARATPRLKVAGPVRILLIEARPVRVPPLPAGREYGLLEKTVSSLRDPGLITLERLQPPTYEALVDRLSDADDVHVIHFDGHGGFDGRSSFLVFENAYCEREDVDAARFAAALAGKKVRLLYASACQTAAAGPGSIFTGLGPGLLVAGIPAIVSMQFSVEVGAAEKFLARFYRSVAQGKPLPDSLADARQLLFNPIFGHAWATPVLYLRSRDAEGRLLEVKRAVRE